MFDRGGGEMKNWWILLFGIVLGILSASIILLSSQPPRGNAIKLLPPPTPIPLQVYISGAVKNPGVHALPPGSRIQDANEAAGGFSVKANRTTPNLAFPLEDGVRLEGLIEIQVED
jgi:competence protein ComEA